MRNYLILLFFVFSVSSGAQTLNSVQLSKYGSTDQLILMNGNVIPVKDIILGGYIISYHKMNKNRVRKINVDKVFSIQYADGNERIVYTPGADSLEYSVPQMRMFVKGEQDAAYYYLNPVNKAVAFAVGAGASFLAIYGLVIPPAYSTLVGAFSPDMNKMKVSDSMLLNDVDYVDGYKTKVRNRKIRNSLISGFIGFAATAITVSIATNN
jgi:hypothetical protein